MAEFYSARGWEIPHSLPEFQRLFPDDAACAAYLEKARWGDGFACPHCGTAGEPFHFENRPGVLRCRKCRQNTGLTVGTVMERSHTPLNVWFWAAYLLASQTPGMSAVQFQRQLGLSRYETAFQILHKLRSGMVRPNQDRIGGQPKNHVEVDETWVGGRTRGEGRGVHHKVPVPPLPWTNFAPPFSAYDLAAPIPENADDVTIGIEEYLVSPCSGVEVITIETFADPATPRADDKRRDVICS